MKIYQIVILAFIGFLLLSSATWVITRMNKIKQLRQFENTVEALVDKQASYFDSFWKSVSQVAMVDTAFAAQEQRYYDAWRDAISQTQNVQQAAQQSIIPMLFNQAGVSAPNPEFKRNLMRVITDGHFTFEARRNDIIAVINQYNDFVTDPWLDFYFIDADKMDASDFIITSSRTNRAVETGEDNDVEIY
jgi:hypothetical protein